MVNRRTSMTDDAPGKSEGVTLDMSVLQKFANDKADIAAREAKLKRDKAQLRKDETVVLEALSHSGVPKISVNTEDGPRTLYVRREMYASLKDGVDPEQAMAVLDELDLADFHKQRITLPSVSAWLREKHDAKEEIPEPIKAVFNAEPVFRVGVTKS